MVYVERLLAMGQMRMLNSESTLRMFGGALPGNIDLAHPLGWIVA
jgi:hypothetical protein